MVFRALAKGRLPRGMKRARFNKSFPLGFLSGLAEDFRRGAKKRQFRNEAELDRALGEIRGLRYKFRPAFAEMLEKVRDMLPQKKRGPRPRLTDSEKQAACSTIDTLKANGMTTKFAIEQTAKDYKVTARMMRRVWESHGQS